MYVKKSPGWENLGDAVSSLLPYVYTVLSQRVGRGLQGFALLTKVWIEEDAETRPSHEKRRQEAPYLWRKLQESWQVEEHVVCR
jgi:hypothetical protein